jgi:hypothetical protein
MIENGSQKDQKMSIHHEKSIPGVLEWAGRWLEWAGRWGPGRALGGRTGRKAEKVRNDAIWSSWCHVFGVLIGAKME